jgi:hypothetical protein
MAGVTPTSGRMKLADLTVPWMYDCYDLLFAVTEDTVNIDAVVKPFQWPVGEQNSYTSLIRYLIKKKILLLRSGWEC